LTTVSQNIDAASHLATGDFGIEFECTRLSFATTLSHRRRLDGFQYSGVITVNVNPHDAGSGATAKAVAVKAAGLPGVALFLGGQAVTVLRPVVKKGCFRCWAKGN